LKGRKLPGACLRPTLRPTDPIEVERELTARSKTHGRMALGTHFAQRLPRRIVAHLIPNPGTELAALTKDVRKAAARAVCRVPLTVTATAGYEKAEVTAGGVDLAEVQRRTLESRKAPGIHLCGEVLDATGRLGGFNFQWAWASGFLAGRGAARGLSPSTPAPKSD
jgi:predicted flavoprotein YhiN